MPSELRKTRKRLREEVERSQPVDLAQKNQALQYLHKTAEVGRAGGISAAGTCGPMGKPHTPPESQRCVYQP